MLEMGLKKNCDTLKWTPKSRYGFLSAQMWVLLVKQCHKPPRYWWRWNPTMDGKLGDWWIRVCFANITIVDFIKSHKILLNYHHINLYINDGLSRPPIGFHHLNPLPQQTWQSSDCQLPGVLCQHWFLNMCRKALQVRRTVLRERDIDGRGETIISWMCRSISTYLSLIFSYGIHLSICKYLLLRVTAIACLSNLSIHSEKFTHCSIPLPR